MVQHLISDAGVPHLISGPSIHFDILNNCFVLYDMCILLDKSIPLILLHIPVNSCTYIDSIKIPYIDYVCFYVCSTAHIESNVNLRQTVRYDV